MQTAVAPAFHASEFLADLADGLRSTPKVIPAKYLYDPLGSALFDAITLLPEYGLTRAETRLLQTYRSEIAAQIQTGSSVVELGSGSGGKTRLLLEALLAESSVSSYTAIDGSAAALDRCRRELLDLPGLDLHFHATAYLSGLSKAGSARRPGQHMTALFLGSSIGNFDTRESIDFLQSLRGCLERNDTLFIGFDLVKPAELLIPAYDDATGVTAAFNRNVLARANRELGANFNLPAYRHIARWDTSANRVEMHLCATEMQRVELPGAGAFTIAAGETIWTESSHKYRAADLPYLAQQCCFRQAHTWVDAEWPFADCLWIAA